jgi:hypothetical protein
MRYREPPNAQKKPTAAFKNRNDEDNLAVQKSALTGICRSRKRSVQEFRIPASRREFIEVTLRMFIVSTFQLILACHSSRPGRYAHAIYNTWTSLWNQRPKVKIQSQSASKLSIFRRVAESAECVMSLSNHFFGSTFSDSVILRTEESDSNLMVHLSAFSATPPGRKTIDEEISIQPCSIILVSKPKYRRAEDFRPKKQVPCR